MFTSKLPISTSVRRPTINADGSTSFMALNRASNIPVSVRKANLFTPQTNRRPFMNGASTAGKSYTSTSDRKQPRSLKPNPDRDEQMQMFDHLVNFLRSNANHIPLPEPKKFFASISTSESTRIFDFLISCLLPDFKFVKLETSVPEALALLEYPYIRSVTRSALLSVTTRNAAVGLLVIFDWLVDQAECIAGGYNDEFTDLGDPDNQVVNEVFKNVILCREGAREACKENFYKPTVDLQSIQDELIQVNEETIRLKQSLEIVDTLEQDLVCQHGDLDKWKEYHEKMKDYMENKRTAEKEAIQFEAELAGQGEEFQARLERLTLRIKTHELSIEDVERYKAVIVEAESKQSLLLQQLEQARLNLDQKKKELRQVLREILKNKEDKLRKIESERDFKLSKCSELIAHEEHTTLEEKKAFDLEASKIRGAIALKQKELGKLSADTKEMSALQQQYRETLQNSIIKEFKAILDDTRKSNTELLAAQAIREKDCEVVKKFLKRVRRLKKNEMPVF